MNVWLAQLQHIRHAYVDTVFNTFRRDLAPGIRLMEETRAYLDTVTFRNIQLLGKNRARDDIIEASAIVAYPAVTLSLVVRPHIPRQPNMSHSLW